MNAPGNREKARSPANTLPIGGVIPGESGAIVLCGRAQRSRAGPPGPVASAGKRGSGDDQRQWIGWRGAGAGAARDGLRRGGRAGGAGSGAETGCGRMGSVAAVRAGVGAVAGAGGGA